MHVGGQQVTEHAVRTRREVMEHAGRALGTRSPQSLYSNSSLHRLSTSPTSVPALHLGGVHRRLGCGPSCGHLRGLPAHLAAYGSGRLAGCDIPYGRVGGAVVEDPQLVLAVVVAVALQQARGEQPLPPFALCEQGGRQ